MSKYSIFHIHEVHYKRAGCSAVAHGGDPQDRAALLTTRVLDNLSILHLLAKCCINESGFHLLCTHQNLITS